MQVLNFLLFCIHVRNSWVVLFYGIYSSAGILLDLRNLFIYISYLQYELLSIGTFFGDKDRDTTVYNFEVTISEASFTCEAEYYTN